MFNSNLYFNAFIFGLMLILLYFKNYLRAVYLAWRTPGPPALPLLGNVLLIRDSKKMEELAVRTSELYAPITRYWISLIPFFLVYEPKHLQIVLSTNRYTTKNMFYAFLHNFIGDGLITNTGEKWELHRKLIQPYFKINILKVHFDAFCKHSDALVDEFKGLDDVNVVKLANRFVLDVLQDTILGMTQSDSNTPYRQGKVFMPHRLTKPWLLLDMFFKQTEFWKNESEHQNVLKNYTRKILENKKLSQTSNNLLQMLINIAKENPEFSEEDVVNEACTFMLAGQDSVGAALTFTLYFLASNPVIQNKAYQEVSSTPENLKFEDVLELKYLEQCIKETLRLCPSVPIFSRRLTEDLPLGKCVLPQGTNILISPFTTHRLPHYFPEPLKYDPERFSAENKKGIHPYAFIPFSGGPRNCIGYKFALVELKTVITKILRKYCLSLVPGHEELDLSYRVTLKAKGGIWLRLKRRD